jgi:F-type H+-transporting ATPase subunit k
MVTLGTVFGGSWLALRGGEKKTGQAPPINASSKDEEAFIQYGSITSLTSAILTSVQGVLKEHRE